MMAAAFQWIADSANWAGDAGIWARLVQHLLFTLAVAAVSAVVALPIGVAIGHTGRGRAIVTLATGAARALPTLGLLTLLALVLGVGLGAPFLALVVLAFPSLLAGAYSGIESADDAVVDAARALGMTEWQVIARVELPAAFPIIMGAFRTCVLQVAATATLAAYTSDVGLGRFLFAGMKTSHYEVMVGSALLVVALTLLLDLLLAGSQRLAERKSSTLAARATP